METIAEQLQLISTTSVILRFLLTTICSGVLGFDRERRNQAAGFRTYIIVSNASALVMMANIYISQNIGYTDLVRMPAAVITGLGFLGAGTILVTKSREVKGLTTAAGLWSVAIIGIAIGAGFYVGGIVCFAVILFAMEALSRVDKRIEKAMNVAVVYCQVDSHCSIGRIVHYLKSRECGIDDMEIHEASCGSDDTISLIFTLKSKNHDSLFRSVEGAREIRGVDILEVL